MTTMQLEQSLEILVDELLANDDLLYEFFRNPYATLRQAGDWGLPLTDSEVLALSKSRLIIWERVAEAIGCRQALAA